ncbi:MAG: C45 family autoproteolytic acyltransferase/hydrolase, partial [Thermomicrobiales bacterium]
LELVLGRLERVSRIRPEVAYERALAFDAPIQKFGQFFAEEIEGLAEGAGLTRAQALLLQIRAEVAAPSTWAGADIDAPDECTTFAILAGATSNGIGIAGQNADLPALYKEISVVAEMRPTDRPATLMLLPAGQLSYIGINDRGMACFANFLTCDGWRVGFPRYFYSRLALMNDTVDDGIAAIQSVERASSRNMLLLDSHGSAGDLETTPTRDARLDPIDDILVHANHYTAPALLEEERSEPPYIANSTIRQQRMGELLNERKGELNAELMQSILRDRETAPDALCRTLADNTKHDTITFASVIAEPSIGALWVAVGPPHENEYVRYTIQRAG